MRFLSISRTLILAALLACTAVVKAQEGQVLSPYSAYGLGDIVPSMFSQQAAMGGVSLGVSNPYLLTPGVAASYSRLHKPVFAVSMRSQFVTNETVDQSIKRSFAQFMGLGIGLPIKNGSWGAGFGIQPVSDVGYDFRDQSVLPDGTAVQEKYNGTGGLNKIYAGISKRLYYEIDSTKTNWTKVLLGAQMNYNFGSIGTERRTIFPSNSGFYNTKNEANTIVRDPSFELSAQYHKAFATQRRNKEDELVKHQWQLTAGAFYGLESQLGARRTDLTTSFISSTTGVEFTQDTVDFVDGAKGTITTPSLFGFGLGATLDDKLTIAAEYRIENWQDLKTDVVGWELPAELATRTSIALGISYNPLGFTKVRYEPSFTQAMVYRLGFRSTSDYLVINGSQLEDYALTAGLSLPIGANASWSTLTLGTELGSRGSIENNSIKEQYFGFVVGFSITPSLGDVWFKKRRIE